MSDKLVVLAIDKDDCLCDTNSLINSELISIFTRSGDLATVAEIKALSLQISTFEYPEPLRDVIWNEIIKSGNFMRYAPPTDLATGSLWRMLRVLRNKTSRLKVVVCTHRGFHDQALELTEGWLSNHSLRHEFDGIHAIKSKDYPNKLKFLEETYPGHTIRLLDDNPFHDRGVIHPYDERVVIYDQINRFDSYSEQQSYRGPSALINMLANELGVY